MKRYTYLYIDDVIWLFRDLTRKRPASMFEQPFLAMLKRVHEKYGIRLQLNIFYRTDPFYGNDEFCLTEMTEAYKKEWEEASDWLKLHLGKWKYDGNIFGGGKTVRINTPFDTLAIFEKQS